MAYRANPFLERMSEKTTSDQEFVRLFSPKILDRLSEDALDGAVHIFRSPPGGGKTTLLRAFTPPALRAFWNARRLQEMSESYQRLIARGVLHEQDGPQALGVLLSCASGYADLPPGATISEEGLFRALLDCRVVLRALRSLASLLGMNSTDSLDRIQLDYGDAARDLKSIPLSSSAAELVSWAEQRERSVYLELDSFGGGSLGSRPVHVRFESVLWLQGVRFILDGKPVAPKRLLMIDDVQRLRRKQRSLLIEELTELRPSVPVWLAERSIALGDQLLSQGAREGRDLREYDLDDLWNGPRGTHQFANFAQNILDRRLERQDVIPAGAFSQYLRAQLHPDEMRDEIGRGISEFRSLTQRYQSNTRYSEWLAQAERYIAEPNMESLIGLYVTRILLLRDESRRQLTFDLTPLSNEEMNERDSSAAQGAAEIFIHNELKVPYYFGVDRLCVMSTSNVEELLALAASLYEGMQAKHVLRRPEVLSPQEQEKLLKEAARRKRDFIPKNHTEGTRAKQLLDSIGTFCRDRTFVPTASYAPGVTGVRLSSTELRKLNSASGPLLEQKCLLRRVLAECAAENLLVPRQSAASTSRESGTVFYLNRTLCAYYGLPLQMGGWQDVEVDDFVDWLEIGRAPDRRRRLEVG